MKEKDREFAGAGGRRGTEHKIYYSNINPGMLFYLSLVRPQQRHKTLLPPTQNSTKVPSSRYS